jgi:hypothetical protein
LTGLGWATTQRVRVRRADRGEDLRIQLLGTSNDLWYDAEAPEAAVFDDASQLAVEFLEALDGDASDGQVSADVIDTLSARHDAA